MSGEDATGKMATDRYGGPQNWPDVDTMCPGQCEGTGFVPVRQDSTDPRYQVRWWEAEKQKPSEDGWHFVRCVTCNGSGKRVA